MALDGGSTLTLAMVIADGGQSLQLVTTNCRFGSDGCNLYPAVISGIARAAQTGSVNGAYGFQLSNVPVPAVTIGVLNFDGSGNVAVSYTSVAVGKDDFSGVPPITSTVLNGTYTAKPDGSGTINLTPGPGQPKNSAFAFVTTDKGSGLLLLETDGNSGSSVSSGTARGQ